MEGGRKWEDLNIDCLVKVFEGVGLESLILYVPFVCKSWHKASHDPKCWEVLDLTIVDIYEEDDFSTYSFTDYFARLYRIRNFSNFNFIKLVVSRSSRSATSLTLPEEWTTDVLEYILEECPALKYLCFGSFPYMYGGDTYICGRSIGNLQFGKLNDLEELSLGDYGGHCLREILTQINGNCHSFSSLRLSGLLDKEDASSIATLIPQVKRLNLYGSEFEQGSLKLILEGCKELDYLDISFCSGDDCIDSEVLSMASHVKTFQSIGSGLSNNDYEDDYNIDYPGSDSDNYY